MSLNYTEPDAVRERAAAVRVIAYADFVLRAEHDASGARYDALVSTEKTLFGSIAARAQREFVDPETGDLRFDDVRKLVCATLRKRGIRPRALTGESFDAPVADAPSRVETVAGDPYDVLAASADDGVLAELEAQELEDEADAERTAEQRAARLAAEAEVAERDLAAYRLRRYCEQSSAKFTAADVEILVQRLHGLDFFSIADGLHPEASDDERRRQQARDRVRARAVRARKKLPEPLAALLPAPNAQGRAP